MRPKNTSNRLGIVVGTLALAIAMVGGIALADTQPT